MSKKDAKNTPAKKDDSMVEVRVINNFLDKTKNKKFMSVDTVYKTDKDRADELVRLGYVVYVAEDPNANGNVDPNADGNVDSNADGNEDPNANGNVDPNADGNVDSNADGNVDPNADDSNAPNE